MKRTILRTIEILHKDIFNKDSYATADEQRFNIADVDK